MLINEILFHVPCPIFWKNVEGAFLGCNKLFLEIGGFYDYSQLIGKKDTELPWKKYNDEYYKDDQYVIKTGKTITRVENIPLPDRVIISETTKTPLMQDGKIIGVLGICLDITDRKEKERLEIQIHKADAEKLRIENESYLAQQKAQAKFLNFVDKIQRDIQSYRVEALSEKIGIKSQMPNSNLQVHLTKRELDVLYYLSLSKSPKEIAQIISILENKSISDSTINAIVNKKLYPKFEVFNIGQLVEKAIMLNLIPFLLDNPNH